MELKNKKIAVIMGGISSEREISLKTGEAIFQSLKRTGYNVIKIDIKNNSINTLTDNNFDIAFIALHGKYGEDGVIQGILDFLKIPYTGTGVTGSAISMDKVLSKRLFRELNIPTGNFFHSDNMKENLDFPVVVKPVAEGSTIGIYIVNNQEELKVAIKKSKAISDEIFFEEYIKGKEVTVGVVNGEVLPVVEIRPKSGFYDYQAKYSSGMTDYLVPAEIDRKTNEMLTLFSRKIYDTFKLKGAVRIDFIVRDNTPFALEVNTIPGMTETSLLPKAAKCAGISFDELVEKILRGI